MKAPHSLLALLSLIFLAFSGPALAQNLTVSIANNSGVPDASVFIMVLGGNSADGQLVNSTPVPLSSITNRQFTMAPGSGIGRVYVSFLNPVTPGEPFTSTTRFDWLEITWVGGPPNVSQANLTAVDQFGIPLAIEALDASGNSLGTKAWSASGDTIINTLAALAPTARVNTTTGTFARIQAPNQLPSAYPDLQPYIDSLNGLPVNLTGTFFSNPLITYAYSGTFQPDGTITLSGTMSSGPNPDITVLGPVPLVLPPNIPGLTLAQQIYPSNGPYFRSDTGGISGTAHTAGENNQFSVVYRDLMAALNNGFIGGKFGNSSAGWVGQPAFAGARTTPDGFFNQFAAAIEQLSGGTIYGYAFSDATTNPLLTISSASTLVLTINNDINLGPATVTGPTLGPKRTLRTKSLNQGRRVQLRGKVTDPDGVNSVRVHVLAGKKSRTYRARVTGNRWIAKLRPVGNRRAMRVDVTATDTLGLTASIRYRVRLPR